MKKQIGCKEIPAEGISGKALAVEDFLRANPELYFTQPELVTEFSMSNPGMNKVLRALCDSGVISRKKGGRKYYYKLA
mgnify:CR=1 FL=1